MVKHVLLLGLIFLIMLIGGTAAAEPNLKPGKWEISTEMGMPGMSVKMPPVTHTQCLTKEDFIPQGNQGSDECQVTDMKEDGDTVSWKITCTGESGKMEGTGKMTYGGDTMEGAMNFVMTDAGMKMTGTIKGTRIGDCD